MMMMVCLCWERLFYICDVLIVIDYCFASAKLFAEIADTPDAVVGYNNYMMMMFVTFCFSPMRYICHCQYFLMFCIYSCYAISLFSF